MTFPKLGPPSNPSKQNYANELQKHLCNVTASLLTYTFAHSSHSPGLGNPLGMQRRTGLQISPTHHGNKTVATCTSQFCLTIHFSVPWYATPKGTGFLCPKNQNSFKFAMFKYNDLQGIVAFFRQCPSFRIYHKPSKDEQQQQQKSTFHVCKCFLSNSLVFHGRFYCTAKKMATLYRLWIQQHNFIAKIYSKLSIFKFWRKINVISEFTHSNNSWQSCWR